MVPATASIDEEATGARHGLRIVLQQLHAVSKLAVFQAGFHQFEDQRQAIVIFDQDQGRIRWVFGRVAAVVPVFEALLVLHESGQAVGPAGEEGSLSDPAQNKRASVIGNRVRCLSEKETGCLRLFLLGRCRRYEETERENCGERPRSHGASSKVASSASNYRLDFRSHHEGIRALFAAVGPVAAVWSAGFRSFGRSFGAIERRTRQVSCAVRCE